MGNSEGIDDDLQFIIDSALSSYPCTAATEIDRNFKYSITHQAVKLQRKILTPLRTVDTPLSGLKYGKVAAFSRNGGSVKTEWAAVFLRIMHGLRNSGECILVRKWA